MLGQSKFGEAGLVEKAYYFFTFVSLLIPSKFFKLKTLPQGHNMLWQELVKIALMGTERAQLSDEVKEALAPKGVLPGNDEARMVLEGAAYFAMMHKSGAEPPLWAGSIPPPAPAELPENSCSPEAVQCLHRILDDTYPLALDEFIHLLKVNDKHLPSELLPDLLDQSRQSPELWEKLRGCLGDKGRWLLQQNPDWQFLLPQPDPSLWDTGNRDQRKALLKNLRLRQPAEARALLESTWSTEEVNSRIAFLKILDTGLSEADEAFLEICLDDRRKEVRQLAVSLLIKIPGSALVDRQYQRTIALFQEKKKGKKIKLEINLPEDLTKEMIRDGIDPRNQWYQGGVKASRLGQMVAAIAPARWEKHFKRSPEEVLDIFLHSNWDQLLFTATSMATALHRDENWMAAILRFWIAHHHHPDWQNIDLQHLIPAIPAELFNQIAIEGLQKEPNLLENSAPIGILLKELFHPWEDQLTILFFKTVKLWLQTNPGQYWSAWHFWNILENAAYLINPLLYPALQKAFDKDPVWYQASEEIDKFMHLLRFRLKMTEGLHKQPSAIHEKEK